ncbi:MAG: hypothetical protein JWN46_781, partial [Acidimicrobiales bacterium]|nr:hypothetical protein [Acidimicrobiales bacterium]
GVGGGSVALGTAALAGSIALRRRSADAPPPR